jgi:hypothetical protein
VKPKGPATVHNAFCETLQALGVSLKDFRALLASVSVPKALGRVSRRRANGQDGGKCSMPSEPPPMI